MLTTPNYGLKKIELVDSPPDITVINPNWDKIDTEIKNHAASLADKVSKSDIIQTTAVNDSSKVPSSVVTAGIVSNLGALANCKAEVGSMSVLATASEQTVTIATSRATMQPYPPVVLCTGCGDMGFKLLGVNWVGANSLEISYISGGAGAIRYLLIYTN